MTTNNETGTPESLEKVRDILFGSYSRDTDKKFRRLEDRLKKETREAREESRKRLDALEARLTTEMKSLLERVKTENFERTAAHKELIRELGSASREFEKGISQLESRIAKDLREVRKQMVTQSKALRDEMTEMQGEIETAQEEMAEELGSEKVDRAALSELFSEIATRLKKEPKSK